MTRKVNITLQTVLAIFPFVSIIPYVLVKKLRQAIKDNIIGFIITSLIELGILFSPDDILPPEIKGILYVYGFIIIYTIITDILGIKKIRQWSREWNENH